MFLKQNVNTLLNLKTDWKSNWFAESSFQYKKHIYEDIFIRNYVSSFFFKWSKLFIYKVLGSIHVFRTYGKLYITAYFFYPALKQKPTVFRRKSKLKQEVVFKDLSIKPMSKYKKHVSILLFFYNLEKILGVQVFFKFKNVCTSLINTKLTTSALLKVNNYMLNKLNVFKYQFREEIYVVTIQFLLHLFKFNTPDGALFANFISSILVLVQKHSQFLGFLKRILQLLQTIFKFKGVKILLSGKLNGFSRAQSKQIQVGSVTLQSFNIPYIEGYAHAFTSAGKIGVKVWIC